jgi:hypothetical protein
MARPRGRSAQDLGLQPRLVKVSMRDVQMRASRPSFCALDASKLAPPDSDADVAGRGPEMAFGAGYNTELPMTKRAIITGITGQDGSYLAELLLEQDTT